MWRVVVIIFFVLLIVTVCLCYAPDTPSHLYSQQMAFIERFTQAVPQPGLLDVPLYLLTHHNSNCTQRLGRELNRCCTQPPRQVYWGTYDPTVRYHNYLSVKHNVSVKHNDLMRLLAHLRAIRLAHAADAAAALIIEESAGMGLAERWPSTVTAQLTATPCDVLQLAPLDSNIFSVHGYVITRAGIDKIIGHIGGDGHIILGQRPLPAARHCLQLVCPALHVVSVSQPWIIPYPRTWQEHQQLLPVLEPYLDAIYHDHLGQVTSAMIEKLYRRRLRVYRNGSPTRLDIVLASSGYATAGLEESIRGLQRAHLRIFVYHRGDTPSPLSFIADQVITIHDGGEWYGAWAYHIHRMYAQPQSTYVLFVSADSVITPNILAKLVNDSPLAYQLPAPLPSITHRPPSTLSTVDQWSTAVFGHGVALGKHGYGAWGGQPVRTHTAAVWQRLLFTLAYSRQPATTSYVAQAWSYLVR